MRALAATAAIIGAEIAMAATFLVAPISGHASADTMTVGRFDVDAQQCATVTDTGDVYVNDCTDGAEYPGATFLPLCANEDGNVDGNPCLWRKPRTDDFYYVDSSEYRN